jgi:hypothetical protein
MWLREIHGPVNGHEKINNFAGRRKSTKRIGARLAGATFRRLSGSPVQTGYSKSRPPRFPESGQQRLAFGLEDCKLASMETLFWASRYNHPIVLACSARLARLESEVGRYHLPERFAWLPMSMLSLASSVKSPFLACYSIIPYRSLEIDDCSTALWEILG